MEIIDELAQEFLNQVDGMRGVFNSVTGEVLIDAPESFTGEPGIDWDDEAAEYLLLVPEFTSSEAYKLRKEFSKRLLESKDRTSLLQALKKKKPFHHFRIQLEALEMMDDWYYFEEEYAKQRMAEWLKEEGLYSKFINPGDSKPN